MIHPVLAGVVHGVAVGWIARLGAATDAGVAAADVGVA